MKVVWRGLVNGHEAELVECHHPDVGKPQEHGGPRIGCADCGATRAADWLPLLPRRYYRPVL